eukprot:m.57771 g.57771  ORF g.57771 m.57771 type:complete len:1038 (-) comp7102_c0_seq2:2786-5899(-)
MPQESLIQSGDRPHSPNAVVRAASSSPARTLGATLSLHLLGIVLVAILHAADYQVFNEAFYNYPYDVRDRGRNEQVEGWQAMLNDQNNNMLAKMLPTQDPRTVSVLPVEVIYHSDHNCLTASNLQSMQQLETALYDSPAYQSICQLEPGGGCRLPRSILRFFDGTFQTRDAVFGPDATFSRIHDIIRRAYELDASQTEDMRSILNYHIGLDYHSTNIVTRYCRTMFYVGAPITGYANVKDGERQQLEKIGEDHVSVFQDFFQDRDRVGDMDLRYFSEPLRSEELAEQRIRAGYLMLGSIFFVLAVLILNLGSIFVSLMTIFGMAGTYLWAAILFRGILRSEYFALPHLASMYILGFVAIADVLMAHTALADALAGEGKPLASALAAVRAQRSSAALAAPMTVVIAFFLYATSNIRAVQSFAIFTGLVLLINAISAAVYLPCVLAAWAKYYREKQWPCFKSRSSKTSDRLRGFRGWLCGSFCDKFVFSPLARWCAMAFVCVLALAFIVIAGETIKIDRKQPEHFRSNTNMGDYERMARMDFGQSDQDVAATLQIVWGLEDLHNDQCSRDDVHCLGNVEYHRALDLSSPTVQKQLKTLCEDLKSLTTTESNALGIRTGIASSTPEVQCFVAEQAAATTFPTTLDSMETLMSGNANYPAGVYSATSFNAPLTDDTYYRHYEISYVDWLTDGYKATPSADFDRYYLAADGVADSTLVHDGTAITFGGKFGGELRYISFAINLTLSGVDLSYDEGARVMEAWDAKLAAVSADLAPPLQGAFHTVLKHRTWAWLDVQNEVSQTVFLGLCLGLIVCFLALFILTRKLTVTALATFSIFLVAALEFGLIAIIEWDIGLVECFSLAVIVAIPSMLVMELAAAYSLSIARSKEERTRRALAAVGAPLVGASVTLVFASLFLFGSTESFLFQFAIIFLSTLVFSLLVIACFFLPALALVGPQEGNARLLPSHTGSRASVAPAPMTSRDAPTAPTAPARVPLVATNTSTTTSPTRTVAGAQPGTRGFVAPAALPTMQRFVPRTTSENKL